MPLHLEWRSEKKYKITEEIKKYLQLEEGVPSRLSHKNLTRLSIASNQPTLSLKFSIVS